MYPMQFVLLDCHAYCEWNFSVRLSDFGPRVHIKLTKYLLNRARVCLSVHSQDLKEKLYLCCVTASNTPNAHSIALDKSKANPTNAVSWTVVILCFCNFLYSRDAHGICGGVFFSCCVKSISPPCFYFHFTWVLSSIRNRVQPLPGTSELWYGPFVVRMLAVVWNSIGTVSTEKHYQWGKRVLWNATYTPAPFLCTSPLFHSTSGTQTNEMTCCLGIGRWLSLTSYKSF